MKKISEEEIKKLISDYIDQFVNKERIEKTTKLVHVVIFEKRWAELTDKEREYVRSIPSLSKEALFRLASIKNGKEREDYLDELARADYIKELAWADYLYGKSEIKPPVPNSF